MPLCFYIANEIRYCAESVTLGTGGFLVRLSLKHTRKYYCANAFVSFNLKNQYKMTVKLIDNFDISNYSVRETASATFKCANFQKSALTKALYFSPINNNTIQFYTIIYPNPNGDSVSVFFRNTKMNETELLVQYKVSIVDVNGEKQHTKDFAFKYTSENYYSKNLYMSRNVILNSANTLMPNGTLKVFVEALVLEEIAADKHKATKVLQKKSILGDLQSLLESGKFSDVVFLVKGKELKAHKAILSARSPVFAAMFEHDLQEKLKNQVDITDIDADVFEEMLRYIYTDRVVSLDKYAAELLIAADKYQLESLKSTCEQALCSVITAESLAKLLQLANLYSAPDLKAKCLDYFAEHSKKVAVTADWDKIISVQPELLAMLFKNFVLKN